MTKPLRTAAAELRDFLDERQIDVDSPLGWRLAELDRALTAAQDERAEGFREGVEAAARLAYEWPDHPVNRTYLSDAIRSLSPTPEPERPAPSTERREALEEAARVVDTYAHEAQDWFRETSESRWTTQLAARLRALASPPTTDEAKETDR